MTADARTHTVLLSLEFAGPVFSGNGVYARTIARALVTHTPGAVLHVISGTGVSGDDEALLAAQDAEIQAFSMLPHSLHLLQVPAERWRKVDRSGGFSDLYAGMKHRASAIAAGLISAVSSEASPQLRVLLVDWSALPMWQLLHAALTAASPAIGNASVVTYLNFRVYSRTKELHATVSDELFYTLVEALTMAYCHCTLALCRVDALALKLLQVQSGDTVHRVRALQHDAASAEAYRVLCSHLRMFLRPSHGSADMDVIDAVESLLSPVVSSRIGILLPPLRESMRTAATALPPASASPAYLTCVVRHSPEKGALKFASACAALAPQLRELTVVPLLAGAVADASYSAAAREALTSACNDAVVVTDFLTPVALAHIFNQSVANVHPCTHDAYGMTIVEAAACGCPSLVQSVPSAVATRPAAAFDPVRLERWGPSPGAYWVTQLDTTVEALLGQMKTLATVGACDLLGDAIKEPFKDAALLGVDWDGTTEAIAAQVLRHLQVLCAARTRGDVVAETPRATSVSSAALGWDEAAFAAALLEMIS